MISVIVPVYNTEQYLHRCIDSILAQTYTDFELLLIDDGSTDSSGAMCDEYTEKDSRVRVFHKANGGANSSRCLGLDNAQGEWITFVDSDDSIREDALEILFNSSNDSVGAVIANTSEDRIISSEAWIKLLLDSKTRCELWGSLYRRAILHNVEFNITASIVVGEDFLTNIQYAISCEKIKLISEKIYNYTQGVSTSLVNSYKLSLEHEKELLSCLEIILNGREHIFAFEIFRKKYLTLERLVFIGQKPYREKWVRNLMREKKCYKDSLGLKEKILLSIPCATISRFMLKLGLKVKRYFKR